MTHKNIHTIPLKRRREGRTNYNRRLKLLLSRKVRAVIRLSNQKVYIQMIQFDPKGDHVLITSDSGLLSEIGWKYSGANISSSYLTGLLMGKRAVDIKISEIIVDLGLKRITKANRLFAAIKGMRDAGLKLAVEESMLPGDDRISGRHISAYALKLKKEDNNKYQKLFSGYIKKGILPEDISTNFDEVKNKVLTK